MSTVTVKALENLFDGLTDKSAPKGTLFKMYEDAAKENEGLGYVEIVKGNPDIEEKPKREVGTMTVDNIKPAEPEKIIKPIEKKDDDVNLTEVKQDVKPKKIL